MSARKLLGIGVGGTVVTAICCFTPALVIILGAIGLAAWLAWLDLVLFPLLVLFLGITALAFIQWIRSRSRETSTSGAE